MVVSYLPVNVGRYRRTLPSNQQFGMVAIQFDNLTLNIAEFKGTFGAGPIVEQEMRAFGKGVVEPVFRLFAPFKEGDGEDTLYTWADRNKHLRDSLRTEWAGSAGGQLILRARKQVVYTIRGNGTARIYPQRGRNIRIELPGGDVIYRKWVGPNSASVRHNWARDAWNYIEIHKYVNPVMQRIAMRIMGILFPQMADEALPPRPVFGPSEFRQRTTPPTAAQARRILAGRIRPRHRLRMGVYEE